MRESLIALVTLLAACTCQPPATPPPEAEEAPPPVSADAPAEVVVLVTVDTLRADFVSFAGYPQPTTPHLESLAREGTWFSHAFAPSSWTAPSMASLFTGVYPTSHGVQQGGKDPETGEVVVPVLADPLTTLAESMRDAGYRTIGTPSNRLLAKDRGFAQGFDTYPDQAPFIEANKVNNIVRRQLRAAFGEDWRNTWREDKVFLWIHYYDPHLPWPPHPKLAPKFAPDYDSPLDAFPTNQNAKQLAKRFPDPDAEDVRRFRAMYAQDVRFFDEQFKLLSRELGLEDPDVTLFVTSDHGEEIFEHGGLSHGNTLFDDVVRVPLLARWPARWTHPGSSNALVNLLDVHATILDVAGIPAPEHAQGQSLRPILEGDASSLTDAILFEVDPPLDPSRPNQIGVTDGRWKLVATQTPERPLGLYDLTTPLDQRTDVSQEHPAEVARLEQLMSERFEALPVAESTPGANADAALIEELRAMGYVQ